MPPTGCLQRLTLLLALLTWLGQLQEPCAAQELADDVLLGQPNTGPGASREDARQESLARPERLTVLASKYLRPQRDYYVLVNLANSQAPATIDLQLTGARDSNVEQTDAKSILMTNASETQTVKFSVGDWPPAEYQLSVAAQAIDRSWNFSQEAPLVYQAKSFSGFIQTDKAVYKASQTVQFRVLCVSGSLAPVSMSNEMNVTITDPQRNLIRQWLRQSNYRGLLTLELALSEEPMLGEYTIEVSARNQQFRKTFQVAEYVLPTFGVSIQLPAYVTYNDSQLLATVKAQYTYGKPVRGHATLTVQPLARFQTLSLEPIPGQAQFRARLDKRGEAEIQVNLARDLKLRRELFEREIEFFALVEEDLTGRKYNRTSSLKVHDKEVKIERLNAADSFKPGLSQLVQLRVAYQDDTPVEDNGPELELSYGPRGAPHSSVRLRPVAGYVEHQFEVPARVALYPVSGIGLKPQNSSSARDASAASGDGDQRDEAMFAPSAIELQVKYRGQTHYLNDIEPFASKSQQYLQVTLPQLSAGRRRGPRSATVGDQLRVHVRATEALQQVVCQGLARGELVWASSPNARNRTELEFEVQVDERMAPETTIMCFYVRAQDKELIGDSLRLPVGGLLRNFVRLSTSREEAKPGQEVELSVLTKANSLVGVLGVDQSAQLQRANPGLDQNAVDRELKSYGASPAASQAGERNTDELLAGADLVVLTNNLVFAGGAYRFGRLLFYGADSVPMYAPWALASPPMMARGSGIVLNNLLSESGSRNPPEFRLKQSTAPAGEATPVRSFFPETWLWQNGTANGQGRVSFRAKVPDTITSWQLSAFALDERHGLGLVGARDKPTTVRVFRPFFIKLNLPHSIIRGETLSLQVIVFNYLKRPVEARVTLENQLGEFEFVEAANSVEEERRSNGTSESRLVEVPAEEARSVSFLIEPRQLGNIELRARAHTHEGAGDALVRKLLVKPEGQTQHFNRAMLLNLNPATPKFRRNVTVEVPGNAVAGSQRVHVSASGDILGAGLAHVDDLLRLPYGCGEQNMINLVPNILLMNYLASSGRLRDSQRTRALRNIELGYQRQLNYLRADGSFSAFGESDQNGSVWLTAYVLKSFQQAKAALPDTIDERVVRRAARYLVERAQPDGSFEELGMLHNRALASAAATVGADGTATGAPSSVYLSAYALIALLQRPVGQQWEAAERLALERVLERGVALLERRLESTSAASGGSATRATSAYDLAIITHALHLVPQSNRSRTLADQAYERLWAAARFSGGPAPAKLDNEAGGAGARPPRDISAAEYVWWSAAGAELGADSREPLDAEAAPEARLRWASAAPGRLVEPGNRPAQAPLKPPVVEPRAKQSAHLHGPDSLDVEMTSLALLSTVKRGELERALPVVRWLISKQNSQGGFASTQDTVLAIEALAAFAAAANAAAQGSSSSSSSRAQAVDIELVYPRAGATSLRRTSVDQLLVASSNALVQQQLRLPDQTGWVQIEATGAGLAVVQVSWQYNLLVSAERPAFYLNPIVDRTSSADYLQLSVCTYYKGLGGADEPTSSNMALVEVELPSGYTADVEALASLTRQAHVKRVDTAASLTRVLVYLDQVGRDELCFTVPAHRTARVGNNKPVPVTIYDYYDRKRAARIFYAPPRAASSCEVCEGEACGPGCGAAPASSAGPASAPTLHEQRRLRLASGGAAPDRNARLSAAPAGPAGSNTTALSAANSSAALELLPLAPVYLTLVSATRGLYNRAGQLG